MIPAGNTASADFSTTSRSLTTPTVPHHPTNAPNDADGHLELPWRPPRIRPTAFPAHPPRLRDGPLMDIGLRHAEPARPDRPALYAQPTRPQAVRVRHVFLGSRFRLRLPSHPASRRRSCHWLVVGAINLHRGLAPPSRWSCRAYSDRPSAFRRSALLRTRTCGFHRIRLKQASKIRWLEPVRSDPGLGERGVRGSTHHDHWSRRLVCPLVGGSSSSSSSGAHLTTSARFRARAPGPVSGRLSETAAWKEATSLSRFPAAFPPPTFASWSSCARRGIGPSSRSAYRRAQ